MRHLLHKIVTKKTERLRACLLLALLITAGGLALGGKETASPRHAGGGVRTRRAQRPDRGAGPRTWRL